MNLLRRLEGERFYFLTASWLSRNQSCSIISTHTANAAKKKELRETSFQDRCETLPLENLLGFY